MTKTLRKDHDRECTRLLQLADWRTPWEAIRQNASGYKAWLLSIRTHRPSPLARQRTAGLPPAQRALARKPGTRETFHGSSEHRVFPLAVCAVSSVREMSAGGGSCPASLLPLAPMRPISQFYSKVPPVLGNRGLHVFEAAGVGVALIEHIVETRGDVEVFLELARK